MASKSDAGGSGEEGAAAEPQTALARLQATVAALDGSTDEGAAVQAALKDLLSRPNMNKKVSRGDKGSVLCRTFPRLLRPQAEQSVCLIYATIFVQLNKPEKYLSYLRDNILAKR